jgi:DNA-binding response OmpR family regulator
VIIVTATGEEGREFVLSLGADEYFTKPFSPTALLRTVEQVLQGAAEGAPGRAPRGAAEQDPKPPPPGS